MKQQVAIIQKQVAQGGKSKETLAKEKEKELRAQEKAAEEKRKKESGGFLNAGLGVAAFLGTLAVLLGLKRRRDHRRDDDKSSYMYGSSYYSDYSSEY